MKRSLLAIGVICLLPLSAQAVAPAAWTSSAPRIAVPFQPSVIAKANTEESMLTVSPDASELYWGVSERWFPMSRISEIWTARRKGGGWSPARAKFSNGYSDGDPFVSYDGKQIYFVSVRPVGPPRKDFDIYVVDRTADGFGEPRNLGAAINSPDDEFYPSVSGDGTIYFASERSGTWKIYASKRAPDGSYGTAEVLPAPVNEPGAWNFNPFVTRDGKTLIFTSQRKSGAGKGDIWVANAAVPHQFRSARNIGAAVNSAEDEFHPTLSPDKQALFFIRRNSGPKANADVHWVSAKGLL